MAFRSLMLRNIRSSLLRSSPHQSSKTLSTAAAATVQSPHDSSEVSLPVDRKDASSDQIKLASVRSVLPGFFSPFAGPVTSLAEMMDTMERVLDNPLFSSVPPRLMRSACRTPWDVTEDEKCFKLRVDMPGISKEEVSLTVEDGNLVMKAEHKQQEGGDQDWSARSYGAYNISIKLPENVDASAIKARMKDGVLNVQAPKVENQTQKHQVSIE